MIAFSPVRKLVLFKNGKSSRLPVYVYQGAALTGQPTAFVVVDGQIVWVKPGESVEFVEA